MQNTDGDAQLRFRIHRLNSGDLSVGSDGTMLSLLITFWIYHVVKLLSLVADNHLFLPIRM